MNENIHIYINAKSDFATNIFSPLTGNFKREPESELKNNVLVNNPSPINSCTSCTINIKNTKNSAPKSERTQTFMMLPNINITSAATIPTPIKMAIASKILTQSFLFLSILGNFNANSSLINANNCFNLFFLFCF